MKKSNVIDFHAGVRLIKERHSPGKLPGFYRGLKKSHAVGTATGWCSASLLTAAVLNQMIQRGSKLWWDLVDLEFGSLATPDSSREDIGIRTVAGAVVNDIDSQSFVTVVANRQEQPLVESTLIVLPPEQVNSLVTGILLDQSFPSGGFLPMLAHLGDAAAEAGLNVNGVASVVGANDQSILISLWDPAEDHPCTRYTLRIYPNVLLKDIDLIKSSLASKVH